MPAHYLKEKARCIQQLLARRYPKTQTHLHADTPWQLLVAVILSAQCTDARVNQVTPKLFARWPDPETLSKAGQETLESYIRSTGFYRNKAKNILASAKIVVQKHQGIVPQNMADLLCLPGVARKTANVVLWTAFGKNEGIAVDTHVRRIANRLGLTDKGQPEWIEQELMLLFPKEAWGTLNQHMVSFGRQVCTARSPKCLLCELEPCCETRPYSGGD